MNGYTEKPREQNSGNFFGDIGEEGSKKMGEFFATFRPSISRKSGRKKFHEKLATNSAGREIEFFHCEPLGVWGHKNGYRTKIVRHLVGAWLGGVWNDHFQESEHNFSEAEICRKIPEAPQKIRVTSFSIEAPQNLEPHNPRTTPTKAMKNIASAILGVVAHFVVLLGSDNSYTTLFEIPFLIRSPL